MLSSCCTQVKYCLAWAQEILVNVKKPLRRRRPASLCIAQMQATNASELLSPVNTWHAKMTEHELVDMSFVAREQEAQRKHRGPKIKSSKLSIHKGVCAYQKCPVLDENYSGTLPKRPTTRCPSCQGGKGCYYHLPCFFSVHRCIHEPS